MNTDPDPAPPFAIAHKVGSSETFRRPPPSTGSTKVLMGLLIAGLAGMFIFVVAHLLKGPSVNLSINTYNVNSYSANGRNGTESTTAHAPCTRGQRDCLPDVNYIDTTGVAYNRDSLAGKVVLVNFWATWCHPCQSEIPDLSRAYDKYKSKGVVFLGVMTDSADAQQLLNFQSDYEMTYPIVRANSDLNVAYNYPDALPTTFLFDRGGKQVYSHVGPLRERDLDSLLDQLVAQK